MKSRTRIPAQPSMPPPRPGRLGLSVGLFLAAVVALGVLLWPGRAGTSTQVDVPEGTNAHRVSRQLVERGVLKSRVPFLVWVRLRGAAQKIHVGRYRFAAGRSAYWIVDDLIDGRTEKIRVTIPEGFASWQIADRLGDAGVCDKAAFSAVVRDRKLEGYLYPATYDFEAAQSAATVAQRLKDKFDQVWTQEMEGRAAQMGRTKHQAVTLASIIEREVRVREEAGLISAVYNNRLKKGMRLEADPTVQYAKGEWVSRLTYADYRNTDSPYNTYRVTGLPPGPICSPGLDSLNAALWPEPSDVLFFVAMEDGRHSFSSNYRDHVNKVNRRNRLRLQKK